MKKILSFILCLCFLCFISSCREKTEYDEKIIARIETTWTEGFGLGFIYKRIFDFENSTVCDITLAYDWTLAQLKKQYRRNPERYKDYPSLEEYEEYLNSRYNTLKEVTAFTEEEGKAFLKEIISFGIYTWKDQYITSEEGIFDATGSDITIIFTDGTEKNTYTYFKYPKNYKRVLNAFEKHFNVGCWMGSN